MLTATPKTLDAGLKALQARAGAHFVHFHAPWCGDCKRTDAGVEKAAATLNASLLRVDVGERAEWRSPTHPLRQDDRIRLKCIPTLVHWAGSQAGERLESELEGARSETAAQQLVEAFIKRIQSA